LIEDPSDAAAPPFPRRVSPTALDRYRRCPRSFLLADIERRPRLERPSPTLCQANAIHHALERFFGLPLDDRRPEVLHQAMRWAWPQHRAPDTFASREEEAEYGHAGLAMLSCFYESFDTAAIPVARERWVSAELPGGVAVYGKVDRIDRRGDGVTLVDYKTGRAKIEGQDLKDESAVMVYIAGAEATLGLPVERVRFLYLAAGEEAAWDPEREEVADAQTRLQELIARAASDKEWAAQPGPMCRWCPVALHCDARDQVALTEIEVAGGSVPF